MSLVVLTFFFPFIGMILSLTRWRDPQAKNAFWLACCYLGAVMIYWPEGTILGAGGDAGRYYLDLLDMAKSDTGFWAIISSYLKTPERIDLYKPIVEYLVTRVSTNGHFMFFVYAIVLGFFLSRNLWYVMEHMPKHDKTLYVLWLLVFFFEVPIWKIAGARFGTAFHMFLYGLLPYMVENKKEKIYWCAIAIFVHFSFIYIALLTLAYVYLPKKKIALETLATIALFFFIGSLFVKELNLSAVRNIVQSISPDSFEDKINAYVTDEARAYSVESFSQQIGFLKLSSGVLYWLVNILLIVINFPIRRVLPQKMNILVYTLFIGGLANLMSLSSGGGRFLHLFNVCFITLLLLSYHELPKNTFASKIVPSSSLLLLIPLITCFRQSLDYFSYTIFGDFITVFFFESNVPLMDFIKGL